MYFARALTGSLVALALSSAVAFAAAAHDCSGLDPRADRALQVWSPPTPGTCTPKSTTVDGVAYPIPDPGCTPGAVNPTLKLVILKGPAFSTDCERNKATSASAKNGTYDWY